MKKIRNEKGAITMITLLTILFMVSFLMTSYVLIANKVKTQKEMLDETKAIYEPKSTMEEIYNSYFTSDNIIPIYTVEQLLSMKKNEKINIDGKIYTFSNDENTTYLLKNDLKFNTTEMGLESDWIPPYEDIDFVANFDWNGHIIEVTTLSGDLIIYDGKYLVTATGNSPINTISDAIKNNLVDYKIHGNSVQNGTPNPTQPVEIQSVGNKINLFDPSYISERENSNATIISNGQISIMRGDGSAGFALFNHLFTKDANKLHIKVDAVPDDGDTTNFSPLLLLKVYDKNGNDITQTELNDYNSFYTAALITTGGINSNVSLELSDNVKYFKIGVRAGGGKITQRMIFSNFDVQNRETYFDATNETNYEIPIKVSNGINETITNIYLDEPLRKVGTYADYIDFEKQKLIRRVEVLDHTGTLTIEESYKGLDTPVETAMELPEIQLYKGKNIIVVDTEVEPSNMSITYNAKQ